MKLTDRWGFLLGTGVNLALVVAVLAYGLAEASLDIAFETSIRESVGAILLFALLCGAAAYGTVEILKRVFALRGLYQQRQTQRWLDERTEYGEVAYKQLLTAMGTRPGREGRTFNLPNEQLAALVSGAADAALASGRQLEGVAALGGLDQAEVEFASKAMRATDEKEAQMAEGMAEKPVDPTFVAQRVRAGVDQLQISLGERWRRYLQTGTLWIAGAWGIAFATAGERSAAAEGRLIVAAVILGGPLAWTLRDLAALIERARR